MIRVLVVDDDFRVADLHASIVGRLPSFEVVAIAHTAAQAVASSRLHEPDLVLLAEYLPDRRGTPAQLVERLVAYARSSEQVTPERRLDQVGIDRALVTLRAEENLMARRIRDAVNAAAEPLTAAEVASAIGVSRATAQRHLARLTRGGAVRLSPRYGTAGRPEHLYGPPSG
ncbi:MAG TPA: helix-turn-helix domain-containing protein [Streptosporangiales bacterium]